MMSSHGRNDLLDRFVAAFTRGIEAEIAALSGQSETFQIRLSGGEELGSSRYSFDLPETSDRLSPGGDASLRTARGEQRVAIDRIEERRVTITAPLPIDLGATPFDLVVAPWFLYERLVQALAGLDPDRHSVELALTLFGKRSPVRAASPLRADHQALDASQRAAVQLCADSNLAFLWGPPGTGKTASLTHVIEELLARDRRILLVSTTNAAIDQVLAKLAARPWFARAVGAGELVRLGRSQEETFGAELADVAGRLEAARRRSIDRLRDRVADAERRLREADSLRAAIASAAVPQQSLFGAPARLHPAALSSLFAPADADAVARMSAAEQAAAIERRSARLTRLRALVKQRITGHLEALRHGEARIVNGARLVMCTLATSYLSPLLKDARFDVLVAEEAGMAPLPPLFHAACLCREKAIMVGDPRQLPPIVQSRDERVQRAIGRSIFEVTAPDPARSDVVAMLQVQYRMHPVIGDLVGRLFYEGRLVHGADPARCDGIASRAPHPGHALVAVDTASRTTCERSARGASRVNPASAEVTAALAFAAVAESAGSIAVITPYAAQARDIRRLLAARRIDRSVECSTIHRFQGRECDVVIIDLVDAAPMRPGLLLSGSAPSAEARHLLNVSISRARGKLVIVADLDYFEAAAPDGIVTAVLREAVREGLHVRWPGPDAR
jgi:hypothetical protein